MYTPDVRAATHTPADDVSDRDRCSYLLQELRCASLRARLWQADIDAVGLALKGGLVTPDQALELLADCDCLHLIAPPPKPVEVPA
jgi:hypothetical protein